MRSAKLAVPFVALLLGAAPAQAEFKQWSFDSFANGSIDGQFGWTVGVPLDQEIVTDAPAVPFSGKSLRFSNATASGSFNQIESPRLTDEAGETTSTDEVDPQTGDRQPVFTTTFRFRSAVATQQTGLRVTLGPSNTMGGRHGVIILRDQADGLEVSYSDTPEICAMPMPPAACVIFRETVIRGGLSRTETHDLRLSMTFAEGLDNDTAQISVNGTAAPDPTAANGGPFTTWENYYRTDPSETARRGNTVPTVDNVLFRANMAGSAAGQGILFDDLRYESSGNPGDVGPTGPSGLQGPNGTNGTNGTDGDDGTDGARGPIGPAGPAGVPGTPGIVTFVPAPPAARSPVLLRELGYRAPTRTRRAQLSLRVGCPATAGLCDGRVSFLTGTVGIGRAVFELDQGETQTVRITLGAVNSRRIARNNGAFTAVAISRNEAGVAARTRATRSAGAAQRSAAARRAAARRAAAR